MYKSLNAVTASQQASRAKKSLFSSCRWRWIKQKSVGLVLFWSFSAFVLGNYAARKFVLGDGVLPGKVGLSLIVLGEVVVFICAWLLADVYIGRYRVIKASMLIMLLATVFWSLSLSLKSILPGGLVRTVVDKIIALMICLSVGGFQANIVQFGMDQLRDSSTIDITSFMCLYMWSFFFSEVFANFAISCVSEDYEAFISLVFPILVGLSVASDFLFSHCLIKEPVTQNPLKLVFQVLRFASKNKYPCERSAYTYWDDKNSSRLDLAMRKYGGLYSAEQVEDVKKFLQILCILSTICLLMGMLLLDSTIFHISIPYSFREILSNATCRSKVVCQAQCFRHFIVDIGPAVIVVFALVWELFVFPIFWKYILRWKILKKHTLAMIVLLTYIASLITIEGIGEHRWHSSNPNGTFSCPITTNAKTRYFEIPYVWLVIPSILLNFGVFMIAQTGLQFVFAQSPYSMKGLLVNATYLMTAAAILGFYGVQMLFHLPVFNDLGDLGCVFWWMLACGVVTLVLIVLFLLACSHYQNRRRDDSGMVPSEEYCARPGSL